MTEPRSLKTIMVHGGRPMARGSHAPVTPPLFQSSTYTLSEGAQEFHDIRYVRLNNTPNQEAVAAKLAALEGAEAALVTPSGTAAATAILLSELSVGDHLLAQDRLYGGTHKLISELCARRGICVSYLPMNDPSAWGAALRPTTRAFWVESLTNPLLEVAPLDKVVSFCREHALTSIIDNTFLTPVLFRPIERGFDVVIHSASKGLNGHTDVVAGVVVGSQGRIERVRRTMNVYGICLDPHSCALLDRGLKTLSLRVRAQSLTAMTLAEALTTHPAVKEIHYPGLITDRSHARAARWFEGFGSVITLRHAGGAAAERAIRSLRLPYTAPSLGGVETLVCRPTETTHAGLSPDLQRALGVTPDLVRVSVGLEDVMDLLEDLRRALGEGLLAAGSSS